MKKIFLGIIATIILLVLLYSSYVYKNTNNSFSSVFVEKLSTKQEKLDTSIEIKRLNFLDTILSSGGTYTVNKNNIDLEKGNYMMHISSLSKKYVIKGKGFIIKNKGQGNIYIDNASERTYIFSLDSILEITLINPSNNTKVNTIYLYPKEYIIFSPNINRLVAGADLLRISQIFSLGYIDEKVIKNGDITETIHKIFVSKKETEQQKSIKKMFMYGAERFKKDKEKLDTFKQKRVVKINGEATINKYFYLFLNPKKKVIYYKNKIVKDLIAMIHSQKIETHMRERIIKDVALLSAISDSDAQEMKNIILYYASLFIKVEHTNTKKKVFFSEFIDTLKDEKNTYDTYLIDLHDSFFSYNFGIIPNVYAGIKKFSDAYSNTEKTQKEKGFFIYFLNKIILSGFDDLKKGKNVDLEDILAVINNYTKSSSMYYTAEKEKDADKKKKLIETGIKEYNEIIKKLDTSIRENYFKREMTDSGLLIKNNKNITSQKLAILKQNIEQIFDFYKKHSSYLKDFGIDSLIKKQFSNSIHRFNFYFQALEDYDKYVAENEKKNQNFLQATQTNEKSDLHKIKAKIYLKQFNYLDTSSATIQVKGINYCLNPNLKKDIGKPYCYEINNASVSGLQVSFLLFPYEENKISNIVINGDATKNTGSYTLDIIQENYKENKKSTSSQQDQERYKFENFFLYTFNPPLINKQREEYTNTASKSKDTAVTRTVKNSLLLGKNGALTFLSDILKIKYDNIDIKEGKDSMTIKIKDTVFEYKKENKSISGVFHSNYIFVAGKKSIFDNPTIKINTNIPFTLQLYGEIDASDFKRIIIKFIQNIENIEKAISIISKESGDYDFEVVFKEEINTSTISSEKSEAVILGGFIKSLQINGKNILTKIEKIDNLKTYFTTNK